MGDPLQKSVSERLNPQFKFVFQGNAETALLQVSGPMETTDQLDAVVSALAVMRDWLPARSDRDRSGEADETARQAQPEATARAEGIAQ